MSQITFTAKNSEQQIPGKDVWLTQTEDGLTLTDGTITICPDFRKMLPRLREANLRQELLVKAARFKGGAEGRHVLDATAGFGEDSLLLAAAGFSVTLCEYNPVITALVKDCLQRAEQIPELAPAVSRMTLVEGDSCAYMGKLSQAPDVIYLDPMFPERQKSALVKKKFQLIHHVESACEDEERMLQAALDVSPHKIVIKRPVKGALLGGKKPSYSLKGKAIRYDVIVI